MKYAEASVPDYVLPTETQLCDARSAIYQHLPAEGIGEGSVAAHLQNDLVQGLNQSSQSPRYYGFVTGGATPAAASADNLVTQYDQNVQVHLPNETIATDLEYHALNLLCELLRFDPQQWPHKSFTTGATASNIIGLACGREHIIAEAAKRNGKSASVAADGLARAMRLAEVDEVQILTSAPHSSIRKAASIIGLGHSSVKDVSQPGSKHLLDLEALEMELRRPHTASIIMVSCSEVNTGLYATGSGEVEKIRCLADEYGAWVHVDGAFGLFTRLLEGLEKFAKIADGAKGLELADSITGDGHKLLNVPYDTGFFFSRRLSTGTTVFQNPGAPYLSAHASSIPSPLNIGLENSRRFRALPVYATLLAYGRSGYRGMLERQILLSRTISEYMLRSEKYELLPARGGEDGQGVVGVEERLQEMFIIVIFRAKDVERNKELVSRINGTRKVYVSGTMWDGRPAARFAVSNWKVDVARDWPVVREVLEEVAR